MGIAFRRQLKLLIRNHGKNGEKAPGKGKALH